MTEKSKSLLLMDCECGGVDSSIHALTSLAAIRIDGSFHILERFYAIFCEQDKIITPEATAITHLEPAFLEKWGLKGVGATNAIEAFQAMVLRSDAVCGHNVAFDIGFMEKRNVVFDKDNTLDTMHLAWDVWSGQKAKLGMCLERIGENAEGAHDSFEDVMMVYKLLRWMVKNKAIATPIRFYPLLENWNDLRVYGYKAMKEKGLI